MLRPIEAVTLALRRSFDFKGRARRSEFWWFNAFVVLSIIALSIIDSYLFPADMNVDVSLYGLQGWLETWKSYPLSTAFEYATLLTFMSVAIRRLHDIGRRGWPVLVLTIASEIISFLSPMSVPSDAITSQEPVIITPFSFISMPYVATALLVIAVGLYLLFSAIRDGHPSDNKYGPSPKYNSSVSVFD